MVTFASPVLRWMSGSVGLGLAVGGAWAASAVFRQGVQGASAGQVTLGLALLIVGVPMVALPALVGSGLVRDRGAPWAVALRKLAAEHGQQVQSSADVGVWFDVVHGGPRFTVLIEPTAERLVLRSTRTARHGVVVVRRGDTGEGEAARWLEVARGEAWSMRAEVRVASAAMAQNGALVRALDRFFAFRGARSVTFGAEGLSLALVLPPPERTEEMIRAGMDVARGIHTASER